MKLQIMLTMLSVLLPLSAQAVELEKLWMPDYVESAVVVSIAGHGGSHGPPGKGHKLLGFTPPQPADAPDRRSWRGIRFDVHRGEEINGVPNPGSLATMTNAPLVLHKIIHHPYGMKINCIELRAETKRISGASPKPSGDIVSASSGPIPEAALPSEPEIHRSLTRVTIRPHRADQKSGTMWIIHEDDDLIGIQYAIELKCVLRPEFFTKRLSE